MIDPIRLADCLKRRACSMRGLWLLAVGLVCGGGCETPSAHTFSRNYSLRGDLPIDPPQLRGQSEDDCANGGHLFKLYCGSCHNARPLGERPFSNYHVALTHMRDQAYLTGKEYRQIMMFLRRWDNVGPPTPPVEPSPKRMIFSQPLSELKPESPAGAAESAPPPAAGPGPWQQPANAAENPAQRQGAPPAGPARPAIAADAPSLQPLPSTLPARTD
jgi:hypothetical protein